MSLKRHVPRWGCCQLRADDDCADQCSDQAAAWGLLAYLAEKTPRRMRRKGPTSALGALADSEAGHLSYVLDFNHSCLYVTRLPHWLT